MGASKLKRSLILLGGFFVAVFVVGTTWLFSEAEYLRIDSPKGDYTAIITYRRLESFQPMFAGQSGDKSGFVQIVDSGGGDYGKIPIDMVWMSRDLEWTESGADLTMVGTWDFSKREYRYWNETQTEEIVKIAR